MPLLRVWDSPDEIDFASLPSRLETKLQVASRLGKGLACVRVDFYEARGRVCCGEITFTDADGLSDFTPSRYDRVFGDRFILPEQKCFKGVML